MDDVGKDVDYFVQVGRRVGGEGAVGEDFFYVGRQGVIDSKAQNILHPGL